MEKSGSDIRKKLLRLRPGDGVIVPEEYIDNSPIRLLSGNQLRRSSSTKLVALDLDDTLLNSDWTCGIAFKKQIPDKKVSSIRYDLMTPTLKGRLQKLRGLPVAFQYDLEKYPFLKNPQVFVQFRPRMLEQLVFLYRHGVNLLLITASSEKRVDFLFKRCPILAQVFENRVIAAETAAYILQQIEETPDSEIRQQSRLSPDLVDASLAMHRERPWSLAAKSPLLVELALGLPGFEYLIDDSEITRDLFIRSGLERSFLYIEGKQMDAPQTEDLFSKLYASLELPIVPPENPQRMGIVHIEDPYYYPFLHLKDQLM